MPTPGNGPIDANKNTTPEQASSGFDDLNGPPPGEPGRRDPERLLPGGAREIHVSSLAQLPRIVQLLSQKEPLGLQLKFDRSEESLCVRSFILNMPKGLEEIQTAAKQFLLSGAKMSPDRVDALFEQCKAGKVLNRSILKSQTCDMAGYPEPSYQTPHLVQAGTLTERGEQLAKIIRESSSVTGDSKPVVHFVIPSEGATRDQVREQLREFCASLSSTPPQLESSLPLVRIVEKPDFIPPLLTYSKYRTVADFLNEKDTDTGAGGGQGSGPKTKKPDDTPPPDGGEPGMQEEPYSDPESDTDVPASVVLAAVDNPESVPAPQPGSSNTGRHANEGPGNTETSESEPGAVSDAPLSPHEKPTIPSEQKPGVFPPSNTQHAASDQGAAGGEAPELSSPTNSTGTTQNVALPVVPGESSDLGLSTGSLSPSLAKPKRTTSEKRGGPKKIGTKRGVQIRRASIKSALGDEKLIAALKNPKKAVSAGEAQPVAEEVQRKLRAGLDLIALAIDNLPLQEQKRHREGLGLVTKKIDAVLDNVMSVWNHRAAGVDPVENKNIEGVGEKIRKDLLDVMNSLRLENGFVDPEPTTAVWRTVEQIRAATCLLTSDQSFRPWKVTPLGLQTCTILKAVGPFAFGSTGSGEKIFINRQSDGRFVNTVEDDSAVHTFTANSPRKRILPTAGEPMRGYVTFSSEPMDAYFPLDKPGHRNLARALRVVQFERDAEKT